MKKETRIVTAIDDSTVHRARFAVCEECGFDQFFVFIVEDQEHSHFQCAGCGTSYCPDGLCEREDRVAA